MVSKKIALSVLCAAVISQSVFAAEGSSVSYSFLSGGLAVDSNGLARDCKKSLEKFLESSGSPQPAKDVFKIKPSSVGGYLTGSYGFDNNVFLEGRLRTISNRKTSFFAGAGYHFPVDDRSDIYLLAGVSQPVLPSNIHFNQKVRQGTTSDRSPKVDRDGIYIDANSTISGAKITVGDKELTAEEKAKLSAPAPKKQHAEENDPNKTIVSFKSKLAPSLEVGYRANLCDEMGVRLAYRLTKDKIEMNSLKGLKSEKSKGLSHELSAGAHYHFTPQLAAEVGYTFTKLPKFGSMKPKDSHMGTVGLRYAFN
ncbi:outer membrane beta-barrel protein [unidentified bacterial endosymbiont]|uniref:outer membrane beta-barrel protein n=1 Tax=unidentified bacterial endosymbiont TaxID=2355 RepID=UPI0020A1E54B|nr:outer membrane beta-barrel protein [unidentified bacterial endosymbiont]